MKMKLFAYNLIWHAPAMRHSLGVYKNTKGGRIESPQSLSLCAIGYITTVLNKTVYEMKILLCESEDATL